MRGASRLAVRNLEAWRRERNLPEVDAQVTYGWIPPPVNVYNADTVTRTLVAAGQIPAGTTVRSKGDGGK